MQLSISQVLSGPRAYVKKLIFLQQFHLRLALLIRRVGFMRQFKKYADRNKTKYAAKICGIRPRSHIRIKPTYRNGEGGEWQTFIPALPFPLF